jgi:hypothetical protein
VPQALTPPRRSPLLSSSAPGPGTSPVLKAPPPQRPGSTGGLRQPSRLRMLSGLLHHRPTAPLKLFPDDRWGWGPGEGRWFAHSSAAAGLWRLGARWPGPSSAAPAHTHTPPPTRTHPTANTPHCPHTPHPAAHTLSTAHTPRRPHTPNCPHAHTPPPTRTPRRPGATGAAPAAHDWATTAAPSPRRPPSCSLEAAGAAPQRPPRRWASLSGWWPGLALPAASGRRPCNCPGSRSGTPPPIPW